MEPRGGGWWGAFIGYHGRCHPFDTMDQDNSFAVACKVRMYCVRSEQGLDCSFVFISQTSRTPFSKLTLLIKASTNHW